MLFICIDKTYFKYQCFNEAACTEFIDLFILNLIVRIYLIKKVPIENERKLKTESVKRYQAAMVLFSFG